MPNQLPMPVGDALIIPPQGFKVSTSDTNAWHIADKWLKWFNAIAGQVAASPQQQPTPVSKTGQNAAIGTTTLNLGSTTAGVYRVSYYARITTAGSVSSSLTVTIGWTDHSVAVTGSGAAMTGNTTTTFQSNSVMFYSDANTPITYSTAYAANAASSMQYELYVVLEAVAV